MVIVIIMLVDIRSLCMGTNSTDTVHGSLGIQILTRYTDKEDDFLRLSIQQVSAELPSPIERINTDLTTCLFHTKTRFFHGAPKELIISHVLQIVVAQLHRKFLIPATCLGLRGRAWEMIQTNHDTITDTESSYTAFFLKHLLFSTVQATEIVNVCDTSNFGVVGLAEPKQALSQAKFVTSDTILTLMTEQQKEKLTNLKKPESNRGKYCQEYCLKVNAMKYSQEYCLKFHAKMLRQCRPHVSRRRCIKRAHKMPFSGLRYLRFNKLTNYIPPRKHFWSGYRFRFKSENHSPLKWPTDTRYCANLSPAEITLAAKLQLSARQYWDCKARIFSARVYRGAFGVPLRLIDVQRVCRVNHQTAARLYEAFKSVRWLTGSHIKGYIEGSVLFRYSNKKPCLNMKEPFGLLFNCI